jgi:hypothetical protein
MHGRRCCADGEYAAAGHRVARVDGEVHQHLLELPLIGKHGRNAFRDGKTQLDVLAQQALEQWRDAANDVADVQHGWPQHLFAAEGEKLLREVGRAVGRFQDLP